MLVSPTAFAAFRREKPLSRFGKIENQIVSFHVENLCSDRNFYQDVFAVFAGEIEKWQNRGLKEIVFVIGGASGVSQEVAERADFSLSLSLLTFTHEMARVVLLEQLYRSHTIIKGFPYQK